MLAKIVLVFTIKFKDLAFSPLPSEIARLVRS